MDNNSFFSTMAIISRVCILVLLALVLVLAPPHTINAHPLVDCGFDQIYNLGDSISDTGNLVRESAFGAATFGRPPYGMNFFNNQPTGRCSDGLLIIDQIAMAAGLPLLNAYRYSKADFKNGVNFAVAGSTALSPLALLSRKIFNPATNSTLDVQLEWMADHFNKTCQTTQECNEKLKTALFLVGEIGGNDYNYAFFEGKTPDEIKNLVPEVVKTIKNAVRRVIGFGAKNIIVPGNFPIGCMPIYLTGFQTNNLAAYDKHHCLSDLNSFAKYYHNQQLQEAIRKLQKENPDVKIVYGDYYNAFQYLLRVASRHGFEIQKACCGFGGDYNFNATRMCGYPGVPVCSDPKRHLSWDGIHLTQEAYRIMSNWLIGSFVRQLGCFRN